MLMKMNMKIGGMVHAHEKKKKGGPQALDLPQEYYNNYESQADMPIVDRSSTLSNLQGVHVTLKDLMNPPSSERCTEVSYSKNNQATTRGMSKHDASGDRMNTQAKVDYNQVANPDAVMIYPRKEEDTYEDEDMNNHTRAHMMRGSRSPNPNVPLSLTGNHHYNKLQATMSPVGQSSLFSHRQGVPVTLKDLTMNPSYSELYTEVSATHFDHDRMNSQAKVGSNQVTEPNNEMKINPLLQGAWKTDKVSIRKEEDTYEDIMNNHTRAHMMRGSRSPNPNVPLSLTGKHHYNKLQATMSSVGQHSVFSDLQRKIPVTLKDLIIPSYYSELEVSEMKHLQKNHVKLDSNQVVPKSDVVMISPDASVGKLNSQTSVDVDKVSNRKEDDDASKTSAMPLTSSNVDHTSVDINNHTSEDWFKMSEAFANGSGLNSQIKVDQVHGKDTNATTISDRNVGKYSKQETVVQRLSIDSTVSQTSDNSNGETSYMALLLCMLQRGQQGCGEDVDPLMQFCRKDTPMVEFNEITKYDVLSDFYDVYMNYVGNRRLRVFVQTRVSEYKSLSNNRNRNLFLNDFVQALPICRFLALGKLS